jgi:hypothetical protein
MPAVESLIPKKSITAIVITISAKPAITTERLPYFSQESIPDYRS